MKRTLLATACVLAGTPALAASVGVAETIGSLGLTQQFPDLNVVPGVTFNQTTPFTFEIEDTSLFPYMLQYSTSSTSSMPVFTLNTRLIANFNASQEFIGGSLLVEGLSPTAPVLEVALDNFAFEVKENATSSALEKLELQFEGNVISSSLFPAIGTRVGIIADGFDLAPAEPGFTVDSFDVSGAFSGQLFGGNMDIFGVTAVPAPSAALSGALMMGLLGLRRRRQA